jgi:hypothetical protein
VSGDRGLSKWLFTATTTDGKKIDVTGCDHLQGRQDRSKEFIPQKPDDLIRKLPSSQVGRHAAALIALLSYRAFELELLHACPRASDTL